MPKIKTIRESIIDGEEVKQTIINCNTDEMKAFVSFLALTGGRISEIKEIKAGDIEVIDDNCWTLSILTKKQRPKQWQIPPRRTLKFPRDVMFEKIIKPYINNSKLSSSQKLFKKSTVFYYKKLKEANPEVYPHLFRHSLATRLADSGVDSYDLKEWFGWKSVMMSDKYVHSLKAIDKIYEIQKNKQEANKNN